MSEKTITVIIPAYNEEKNIAEAIASVKKAVEGMVDDYELIVFDDGSRDRTGEVTDRIAQEDSHVRVIHNDGNQGFGYSYQQGVKLAKMEYISIFPGDNDMAWESLRDLLTKIGQADIITSYMENMHKRSWGRRLLSRSFTLVMNTLFGLRLRYFNGPNICKRAHLQAITIRATSLMALAECLVRLIKSGSSYKEICFAHIGRKNDQSKALHPKSIAAVLHDVFVLWKDMTFRRVK